MHHALKDKCHHEAVSHHHGSCCNKSSHTRTNSGSWFFWRHCHDSTNTSNSNNKELICCQVQTTCWMSQRLLRREVIQWCNDHCYDTGIDSCEFWSENQHTYGRQLCLEIYCVLYYLMFKIGGLCNGIIAIAGVWFSSRIRERAKLSIIQTEGKTFSEEILNRGGSSVTNLIPSE